MNARSLHALGRARHAEEWPVIGDDAVNGEIAAQIGMQDAIAAIRAGELVKAQDLLADAADTTSLRRRELRDFCEATRELASEGIPTLQDREDLIHDYSVGIEDWDSDLSEERVAS